MQAMNERKFGKLCAKMTANRERNLANEEILLARDIMKVEPTIKRDDALREARRIVEARPFI